MKHIVVDLEMNIMDRKYKKERNVCQMEIIQIGAVALDDDYKEVEAFSTYVKPQYNDKVEEFYMHLTGISTQMVQCAPIFKDALDALFSWMDHFDDDIEVVSWSNSDCQQIINEARLKDYTFDVFASYVMDSWTDFQLEFDSQGFIDHQTSLKEACQRAGLSMEGRLHDGLDDARNTAHLLHILRDDELYDQTFGKLNSYLNKTSSCTIGDVIDFSQFHFDDK